MPVVKFKLKGVVRKVYKSEDDLADYLTYVGEQKDRTDVEIEYTEKEKLNYLWEHYGKK